MSHSAFPDEITQRYSIKGIIGAGGMGQILRAFDPNLNIDVAIKILHNLDSEITAIRLQREAIAAGKLSHPNITRIYDFGLTSNNVPFIVMEFLDGEILSDVLGERGPLPVEETIDIFKQICNGLEHAHKNGIVHRDLKPSNIIVVKDVSGKQVVKILDFGLAQLENAEQKLTAFNTTVGSPAYMSPEQVCALEVDSRSDIYSLGCLLFETLTGVLPLKGGTPIETMTMQRDLAPPLISDASAGGNFPQSLEMLVDKCLAKLPEDRPQKVEALALELDSIQHEILRARYGSPELERPDDFEPNKFPLRTLKIALNCVLILGFGIAFASNQYLKDRNREEKVKSKLFEQGNRKPATLKTLVPEAESNKVLGEGHEFTLSNTSNEVVCVFKRFAVDQDLKKIEGKNIQNVVLKGCHQLKGPGLQYLSKLPLTALDLEETSVDDESIKNLASLSRLSTLKISSANLSDACVEEIIKLKNLEILFLASENLTNKAAQLMTSLPKLRFLKLESIKLNDDVMSDLSKIKQLEGLSLCGTSCSGDIGVAISRMPSVKSISLAGNKSISSKSLIALGDAGINQLDISGVPLASEQWRAMKYLKKLFRLDLKNSQSSKIDIDSLLKIPSLKYLDLHASPEINDDLIESLSKLKIQYLDLSQTEITDKQLIKLAKISTLVNLRVKDCPSITSLGAKQFHNYFNVVWRRDCILELSNTGKNFDEEN
ncbi:MAG: protein kinase [Candidatus Melainabacteria bacterium]|nr:protein kinase [Candidatus Melainabacteria bacterium]